MRVRTSDAPCRCPEGAKYVMRVRTVDGGTRPVKVCTRCGQIDSPLADAWKTREFPEESTLPPSLLQSAASNEANRRTLELMTRREIRRLQQLETELRQGYDAIEDPEEREERARALLQVRDALQFETETLAMLVMGDSIDESETGDETQRAEQEPNRGEPDSTIPPS